MGGLTRRALVGGVAAAALRAQQPPRAQRTRPMLCLFSKHLARIEYTELGAIIKQLGFEGCDLTVRKGGHVEPAMSPVDMVRAVECIRGDGVEVPMITTDFTSAADPHAANVLGLSGRQYLGIPYFKPGYYMYGDGPVEQRLAEVRRDLAGLVNLARARGIAAGIHNHAGNYVGEAVWDIRELIRDLEPDAVGYYFDPCHATAEGGVGGWQVALRMALPRLKMLAMKDFYWEKSGGKWTRRMCPMGEGMVEWPKVFAELAGARFTGPMSLHVEYNPKDVVAAVTRDLEWVRKHAGAAWAAS
jgi:sugar phosphate isomerase/epimerase